MGVGGGRHYGNITSPLKCAWLSPILIQFILLICSDFTNVLLNSPAEIIDQHLFKDERHSWFSCREEQTTGRATEFCSNGAENQPVARLQFLHLMIPLRAGELIGRHLQQRSAG